MNTRNEEQRNQLPKADLSSDTGRALNYSLNQETFRKYAKEKGAEKHPLTLFTQHRGSTIYDSTPPEVWYTSA